MSIKVASFLGSPREGGNTEILLNATLQGVKDAGGEARVFRLEGMNLHPCRNCGVCSREGKCVVKDDMSVIYEAIRASDRLILASPIYFFALSAQAKLMIDRCQAFWSERYLLNRPIIAGPKGRKGLLLLVGAYKKKTDGVKCCEVCAEAFFHSVSVRNFRTLSYLGVDAAGAIREHPVALGEAYDAGRNLAA